ncbi:response regulator [Synechococcus moorigangaii CMS01]|nr:response regulator [Synechococcus moorigangaii CMS01]
MSTRQKINTDNSLAEYQLVGNPQEILQQVASTTGSGYINAFHDSIGWQIYFKNGNIAYAYSSVQSLQSFDYHFHCLGLKASPAALKMLPQSNSEVLEAADNLKPIHVMSRAMDWYRQEGYLNLIQMTRLLENLTKEAIESFLWLMETHYQWVQEDVQLPWDPELEVNLNLEQIIQHFKQRTEAWQEVNELIKSPYERPYLFSHEQSVNTSISPALEKLKKILRGFSIREIALLLNQDEMVVAKLLYPYVQKGNVFLGAPKEPFNHLPTVPRVVKQAPVQTRVQPTKVYKIACVDDSPTILNEVHRFLDADEYEVIKIEDPIKAASILFRLKPDLILMDITMPEINGYKLCSLLKNSVALRETPIVMVTGRTGFVDKARAKLVGASDYLTKPFTRGSLLSVVEKYVK